MPHVDTEWRKASHARASFHADVYEWQIAAILATAKLDAAAKARIVATLGRPLNRTGSDGGSISWRMESWQNTTQSEPSRSSGGIHPS